MHYLSFVFLIILLIDLYSPPRGGVEASNDISEEEQEDSAEYEEDYEKYYEDSDDDEEYEEEIIHSYRDFRKPLRYHPRYQQPRPDLDNYNQTTVPDFLLPTHLEPGQLERVFWRDGKGLEGAETYVIGVPEQFATNAWNHFQSIGLVDLIRKALYPNNRDDVVGFHETLDGVLYEFRVATITESDMIWIDPANEECYESLLSIFRQSGYDIVLNTLGHALDMDSIVIDKLSIIATSWYNVTTDGNIHQDLPWARGYLYNTIIPVHVPESGFPFLVGDETRGYEPIPMGSNVGLVVGADSWHGTGNVDYTPLNDFRLSFALYTSDITQENADDIEFESIWPGDPAYFKVQSGREWRRDGSVSLLRDEGRPPFQGVDKNEVCAEQPGECSKSSLFRESCPRTCALYTDEALYNQNLKARLEYDVAKFEKDFGVSPEEYKTAYLEATKHFAVEWQEALDGDEKEEGNILDKNDEL